ncbi:MAG: DMT family transporter [Hyphomicrobiales bacterium]
MLGLGYTVKRFVNNGVVVLLIATFFWGGNAVAGKLAHGEVSPMLLTFFRWSIASCILFPLAKKKLSIDWPVIRKNLIYFALMGSIGFTTFNVLLYTALTHTSALNVTIEQAAMPMFIFLINFIIFRSKPFFVQIIGYIITLIGVAVTVTHGDISRLVALDFNIGDVIMMGAAFLYAAFTVALRSKPDVHWLSFLIVLTIAAALSAVPYALYEASTPKFIFPSTTLAWGIVLFAATLPSIASQAFYIKGNELLGANSAALFLNAVPVFGALLAVLVLGEAFLWYHAVGMLLVMGGIMLAQHFANKRGKIV